MTARTPAPKTPAPVPADSAAASCAAPWDRRDTLALLVVCLVALLVRVAYLLCLRSSVFFDHLVINAAQYEGWARTGYPAGEPLYQSPLYVAWLRAVFVSSTASAQLLVARSWQVMFGTASVALAFLGARQLAGRPAAWVAGLLGALAGMSVYFDLEILPTSLATLLLTATLTGHILLSLDAASRPRRMAWAGIALLAGLAVITRPNLLVLLPVLALHAFGVGRRRRPANAALGTAALYLLLAVVPVGLVAARNTATGQGFVLLTTSVGDNLLLAHNDEADGFNPFPPAAVSRTLQEYEQRGLNMVQRTAAARQAATQWMRHHPAATARLWLHKAVAFYNRADIPNNRSIRQQQHSCAVLRLPPVGWVGMGLLLPLALAGLMLLRRTDVRLLLGAVLVCVPVSLLPFLVCARFRTPLVPALCMLAGVAVAAVVPPRRTTAAPALSRRGLSAAGALFAGIALAWPNWFGVQDLEFPRLATNRAHLLRRVAESERAAGHLQAAATRMKEVTRTLEEAVRQHPDDATAQLWLADMRREAGALSAAETGYRRALELDPTLAEAHASLARLALQRQHPGEALEHFRRALALRPNDTRLAVDLAELLARTGDTAASRELLEQQLQRSDLTPQERQSLERLMRAPGRP